jgi:hypothetical protein
LKRRSGESGLNTAAAGRNSYSACGRPDVGQHRPVWQIRHLNAQKPAPDYLARFGFQGNACSKYWRIQVLSAQKMPEAATQRPKSVVLKPKIEFQRTYNRIERDQFIAYMLPLEFSGRSSR